MNVEALVNQGTEIVLTYGPKLVAAIAVLVIGGWVVKAVIRGVAKAMDKGGVEPSLNHSLLVS